MIYSRLWLWFSFITILEAPSPFRIIGDYLLKKLSFLLGLLEHVGFEIYIHYGAKL